MCDLAIQCKGCAQAIPANDVDINQLFCTECVAYRSNDQPQYRMCVNAILQDSARVELIKGLEDPGQAFYLEDLIERHLRIPDRPVPREHPRGVPS